MADELPDEIDEEDEELAAQVEGIVVEMDAAQERRLWIETLVPVITSWRTTPHPSVRVQFALDCMHIAAAELISLICHAEFEGVTDGGSDDS
jgi:hypothetical protein